MTWGKFGLLTVLYAENPSYRLPLSIQFCNVSLENNPYFRNYNLKSHKFQNILTKYGKKHHTHLPNGRQKLTWQSAAPTSSASVDKALLAQVRPQKKEVNEI